MQALIPMQMLSAKIDQVLKKMAEMEIPVQHINKTIKENTKNCSYKNAKSYELAVDDGNGVRSSQV